jgi:hypothetical protein
MKIIYFTSLIKDIIKKQFPVHFLLDNLVAEPNEFMQSVIDGNEEKFFELLPNQSKKEINQVYLFKTRSYTPSEDEIMVPSAKSLFELALEKGNEKILLALINTQLVNLEWKNKDNLSQIENLFNSKNFSLKPIDHAIDCLIAQGIDLNKVKTNKKKQTLLELLAWSTAVYTNDPIEEHNQQKLEIKIAQKLVDNGVNINHVSQIQRGNALNIAILHLKTHLIDYLLSLDIEKLKLFDNLAKNAYKSHFSESLTLMGQVISQGFLVDQSNPQDIFPIIKKLHELGFEYQDISNIYQDDSGFIEIFTDKIKDFIQVLDEQKLLDNHIKEVPSSEIKSLDNIANIVALENKKQKRKI